MASATHTVRIRPETHRTLKKLARESKRTLPDILETVINEYDRRNFLEGLSEDFARLREDPQAWQEELEERALWECTLMDGLEDDPYPMEAMLSPRERAEHGRLVKEEKPQKPRAKTARVKAPQRALHPKSQRTKVTT